jgi:signal transduction histidine kinase
MLVGFGIFAVLAVLFYHLSNLLDETFIQPPQQTQQSQALDSATRELAGSPANWRDPAWQAAERARLAGLGFDALVTDPSGVVILSAGNPRSAGEQPAREMAVLQADGGVSGGQLLGTVALFTAGGGPRWLVPVPMLGAIVAIILALLFVRFQMGRYVVKPLEAIGEAARRIANGSLDFELPQSRVREVVDVSQAFEAMGAGLRESLERQAELEEERRFFVGAIAHDLRTPLFSLRGYLEGLQHGLASSPEKAAAYIAVCRQKADQLDRLVSDLFAYTRVEYLEQTLQWGPVELDALLRRVVEGARPRARDKGVTITSGQRDELCPEPAKEGQQPGSGQNELHCPYCMVQCDEHLLERAVENLLDNALRYTPQGGRVEVGWREDRGTVLFTVADTGPGIAPSDMPHLFNPLYRGESSRNRETGGTGLGLAIARRVLLAHGGDLHAANCPAGGAIFTGRLPLHSPYSTENNTPLTVTRSL